MAGQGPMTGNFGHFFVYAPKEQIEARDYGVYRYGMETMRLLSVLDQHLEGRTYMVGDSYTIADIICFPWVHQVRTGYIHANGIGAAQYLSVDKYKNVIAWADRILSRPAVQRGITVCKNGLGKPWLESTAEK
jgi:GSH-dependent disulfide-bond oxidoreductase